MRERRRLSLGEFLADMRGVVRFPARRFALILERGSLWGSLVLLIAPTYPALAWVGGIYFNRDPIPGYSFLLPAVVAVLAGFLKLCCIHFSALLLQGRRRGSVARGSFRKLVAVFGYTGLPALIALALATLGFLTLPSRMGALVRDFRTLSLSLLIAVSLALFVWSLILTVIALRAIYPMRDLKIVAAFFIGSLLVLVSLTGMHWVAEEVKVGLPYLQPIVSERILRFYTADAELHPSTAVDVRIHVDVLRYRFKAPERFELAVFAPSDERVKSQEQRGGEKAAPGAGTWFGMRSEPQVLARIVGLPGEEVEVDGGRVKVDGRWLDEPYLTASEAAALSLPQRRLGADQFLILPDDRALAIPQPKTWYVAGTEITGRAITNRWPLGWLIFRPAAFYRPAMPDDLP